MDTRTFYGQKEHDRAVRVIPSDSEDSEIEESDNEDSEVEESQEDWIPERQFGGKKQIEASKPKKWGYKILVLAGSDGVPYNLEIYTGRVVQPPELADVGVNGNVVLRLAQPISKQNNYKLFFDNWFMSVPLVLTLAQQGIHCAGTVHGNRLPGVNLMCDAELKRVGRGSFEQKMAIVGETTLHTVSEQNLIR
ncbi:hypothetical protein PO909_011497 [Leuciscus waleckii]